MTADEAIDQALKYAPLSGALFLSNKVAQDDGVRRGIVTAMEARKGDPKVRALIDEFRASLHGTSKCLPDFNVGDVVRVDVPEAPPNMRGTIKAFVPDDTGGKKALVRIGEGEVLLPLSLLTPISAVDLLGEVLDG